MGAADNVACNRLKSCSEPKEADKKNEHAKSLQMRPQAACINQCDPIQAATRTLLSASRPENYYKDFSSFKQTRVPSIARHSSQRIDKKPTRLSSQLSHPPTDPPTDLDVLDHDALFADEVADQGVGTHDDLLMEAFP